METLLSFWVKEESVSVLETDTNISHDINFVLNFGEGFVVISSEIHNDQDIRATYWNFVVLQKTFLVYCL